MTEIRVIQLPASTYEAIEKKLTILDEIKKVLTDRGDIKAPEHLTVKEFCGKAKIGRNKYEEIKAKIRSVRVSERKILIPATELDRWFAGEIK